MQFIQADSQGNKACPGSEMLLRWQKRKVVGRLCSVAAYTSTHYKGKDLAFFSCCATIHNGQ